MIFPAVLHSSPVYQLWEVEQLVQQLSHFHACASRLALLGISPIFLHVFLGSYVLAVSKIYYRHISAPLDSMAGAYGGRARPEA